MRTATASPSSVRALVFGTLVAAALAAACSVEPPDRPTSPRASASVGTAPDPTDAVLFEFQVEQPVAPAGGGCQPRFPAELRSGGVSGVVLAQFVVGTDGRVEPGSFKALTSDHDQFTDAVRSAMPCLRYLPAETGGHKVRQLVQQPFAFSLSR